MVKPIELGSLYFGNKPVPVGTEYNGKTISIRDAAPGMGIHFIKWEGLYVAAQCVCISIGWADLNKHGFIFGFPVRINGVPYLCRSLKVGAKSEDPNEWDALLDTFGEDDDLWHWSDYFFWGQETPSEWPSSRAVRGYDSARYWGHHYVTFQSIIVGFRPVLEPLPLEPLISDALVGHNIKIYGEGCSIVGHLVGYSDYDLEITTDNSLPENCSWIRQTRDAVFIDREAIVYLQEEG